MRHFYYYVPPCPRCKNRKTGHYMRMPYTGSGFTKEESLKNGEWVRFRQEEPIENCFCMSCGHEWADKVTLKWWPFERIQEERIARGTESAYQALLEEKGAGEAATFDFARKRRESRVWESMNYEKGKRSKNVTEDSFEPEIIDMRKKDTIELLYSDEELIRKVREVQG